MEQGKIENKIILILKDELSYQRKYLPNGVAPLHNRRKFLDTEYHGEISMSYFLEKHHSNLVKDSDKHTVFTMIGHINLSYSVVTEASR